jgi:hypothetical protein
MTQPELFACDKALAGFGEAEFPRQSAQQNAVPMNCRFRICYRGNTTVACRIAAAAAVRQILPN